MRRPAGVLCRALLFDSFVKGYFVLAYTNQYPYPASSTSRRSLSLIYRDRLAISYHDHAQQSRLDQSTYKVSGRMIGEPPILSARIGGDLVRRLTRIPRQAAPPIILYARE